jgi:oxalyl-CoA decarboxylase
MGYAIGAAVETSCPVVAIEGDSALGFSGTELETICRYQLPIVVVVFNNGGVYKGDEVDVASCDPTAGTESGHLTHLNPKGIGR